MILIFPFEKISIQLLKSIKKKIGRTFHSKAKIEKEIPLPRCHERPSPFHDDIQLNAEDFLPFLKRHAGKEIAIGITEKDLYVSGLNFVFGLASENVCVISLARLKSENKRLFLSRARKEAIHELGHVHGLGHCSNEKCVMHFSNCIEDTDKKEEDFCEKCKVISSLSL